MEAKHLTGVHKRQQIHKASRHMFLWVAAASIVVAFAVVAAQFLISQALFNNKVIGAKSDANSALDANLKNADSLKNSVNALIANPDLSAVKASPTDNNLKVILDALPTEDDPTALATSLQHAILNRSGVTIESLSVGSQMASLDGLEEENETTQVTADPTETPFEFVIRGNFDQIKSSITDLERVIRPMSLRTIDIRGNDNELRANVQGVTYYLPGKTVNVTTKTIKP